MIFFTFYIVLPLVTNFCTIYLRVFPWVPVTSSWINVSACLWQYGHTYFWQLRKSLKMVFLSFGSRPSSHYQPEGPKLKDQSRRPYLNPSPTIFQRNCLTKRGICSLSSWLWLILGISTSLVVVFQSLVSTNRYVSTFFVVIFSSSFLCSFPLRNSNLSLKSAKVAEQARGDPH